MSGDDRAGGVWAPGFAGEFVDPETPDLLITQFASFSFDEAVDIGGVIVDDVSNADRSVWMAYSDEEIDLSNGLGEALSSMTVVNSQDDGGDGLFTHELNGTNVKTLLVGAPIQDGTYAGIESGVMASAEAGEPEFYIRGLSEIGLSDTGVEVMPVPLPSSGFLLLFGLGASIGLRRKRAVV